MQIYLASPYSGPSKTIRTERYNAALKAVADLSRANPRNFIYSPIVYFHHLARDYDLPTDAGFWWAVNETALQNSKVMYVLALDGWRASPGVQMEIKWCMDNKRPWFLVDPETYQTLKQ